MGMIMRAAFNNRDWAGKCENADRDRRLFQCTDEVVNTGYKIDKNGVCKATCWESTLCTEYWWMCLSGNFGDRATGPVYFVYRDLGGALVLWGRSTIAKVQDNLVYFKKFKPLAPKKRLYDLTYEYLESIGVPSWLQGTFRYIPDEAAEALDELIDEGGSALSLEPISDIEGKKTLRRHLTIERSSRLVKQFKASLESMECTVCGFDFSTAYGQPLGEGFIEAHHVLPLSALEKAKKISINDLAAVCSNCHRMLHKNSPPLTIKQLTKVVKESGQ